MDADLDPDQHILTISMPLAIRKQGGRKQVIAPDGAPACAPRQPRPDGTLVKALARAFRWRRLLEGGSFATIQELAAAERINASYVSRLLRLSLLAPEIVEAILEARAPERTMARLFRALPVEWKAQRDELVGAA